MNLEIPLCRASCKWETGQNWNQIGNFKQKIGNWGTVSHDVSSTVHRIKVYVAELIIVNSSSER